MSTLQEKIERALIRIGGFHRFSGRLVCEAARISKRDVYRDYPDADPPEPWHFYTHTCKRCGKEFTI